MSRTVDQKVVQMQFDNANFEKNVRQSMSTLEKLKSALNFDGATKGLDQLNKSVNSVDFSKMENASYRAGFHFQDIWLKASSVFEYQVANKIISSAERMVKALTIDQLSAGWDKFTSKTQSVQTIMSATNQTWEENAKAIGFAGSQMDFVSEQLNKLNWFSDETSYSFKDMTDNIGKFTAAGVSLTTSVEAMEGISLWAARSGQNTQAASRAMYNLSQALGTGAVKLIDWKSIENANMATQEFKQTAIQTAEELGTLKKVQDGVWKTMAGHEVTVTNFNDALKDQWFNSKVLITTLQEYGKAATLLNKVSEVYDVTATQTLSVLDDYTEGLESGRDKTELLAEASKELGISSNDLEKIFGKLTSKEYELSLASFKAGQECKTFGDVVDATADAVSTGWMNIFESIFGNYEQAKELWTDLCDVFYDTFVGNLDSLRTAFSIWSKDLGGRDDLFGEGGAFWNIINGAQELFVPFQNALEALFPSLKLLRTDVEGFAGLLKTLTGNLKEMTSNFHLSEETAKDLEVVLKTLLIPVKVIIELVKMGVKLIPSLLNVVIKLAATLINISSIFAKLAIGAAKAVYETEEFQRIIKATAKIVNNVKTAITNLVNLIASKLTGSMNNGTNAFERFYNIVSKLTHISLGAIATVLEAIADLDFSKIATAMGNLKDRLEEFCSKNKALNTIYEAFKKVGEFLITLKDGFVDFFTTVGEKFKDIHSWEDFVKVIAEALKNLRDKIVGFFTKKDSDEGVSAFEALKQAFSKFVDLLTGRLSEINWARVVLIAFAAGILAAVINISNAFTKFGGLALSIKTAIDTLNTTIQQFTGIRNRLKELKEVAIFIATLTASLFVLSTIDSNKLKECAITLGVLAGGLLILGEVMAVLNRKNIVNATSILDIVGYCAAIAAGSILLASAVKVLENTTITLEKMKPILLTIGALMLELVAATTLLGLAAPKFAGGALTLVSFAGAVLILTNALEKLANVKFVDIQALTKALVAVMTGFALVSFAARKLKFGSFAPVIAIAIAIVKIAPTIKELAQLQLSEDAKRVLDQIVNIVRIIGSFALIIDVLRTFTGKAGKVSTIGKTFKNITSGILEIALGAVILVYAFKQIYELVNSINSAGDAGRILAAIGIVAAISALVTALSVFASHHFGKSFNAKGILAFSGAMISMTATIAALSLLIVALGDIPPEEINTGIVIVSSLMVLFGALMLCSKATENVKTGPIIALTAGLGILVTALTAVALLIGDNGEQLVAPMIAFVVALGSLFLTLVGVSKLANDVKMGPIIALVSALSVTIAGIMLLKDVPFEDLGKVALALGAVLLSIGIALAIPGNSNIKLGPCVAMVAALAVTIAGLAILGKYDWLNLAVAAASLAGVMLSVGYAMKIAEGSIQDAAVFAILAGGIAVLSGSLWLLGQLPWEQILVAAGTIVLLVVALGALGGIAVESGAIAVGLEAIAFAILQIGLGIGVLSAGVGILGIAASMFVDSLTKMWVQGEACALGIRAIADAIADAIMIIATRISAGFTLIAKNVASGISLISVSISGGILNIAASINQGLIIIGEGIGQGINAIIAGIFGFGDDAYAAGEEDSVQLFNGLDSQSGLIAALPGKILASLAAGFSGGGSMMFGIGGSLIGSLISGLTMSKKDTDVIVENHSNQLYYAENKAIKATANTLKKEETGSEIVIEVSKNVDKAAKTEGKKAVDSTKKSFFEPLTKGFSDAYDKIKNSKVGESVKSVCSNVKDGLSGAATGVKDFVNSITSGNGLIDSVLEATGIEDKFDDVMKGLIPSTEELTAGMGDLSDATGKAGKAAKETKTEFEKMYEKIEGSIDLFSEFNRETDITSDQLLGNMKSQIEGMAEWSNQIAMLAIKGIDQGLLQKLADMGPESYKYTSAFVSMTAEQLAQANMYYRTSLLIPGNVTTQIMGSYQLAGQNAAQGFIMGVDTEKIRTSGENAAKAYLDALTGPNGLDSHSPSRKTREVGVWATEGLKNGVSDASAVGALTGKLQSMCTKIVSDMRTNLSAQIFKNIGMQIPNGLVQGIAAGESDVVNEIIRMCESAVQQAKNSLSIHSPSRVFAKIGDYVDQGFAKGISDNSSVVDGSITDMAKSSIDLMKDAISSVYDIAVSDMDVQPTIRPVVDLTDVKSGMSSINSLTSNGTFGLNPALILNGINAGNVIDNSELVTNNDNSAVVDAIKSLKEDITGLKTSMSNIKMVLDSGTLVGEMVAPMDAALGQRAVYAGRGI